MRVHGDGVSRPPWLRGHLVDLSFGAVLVAAGWYLLHATRKAWFQFDDWRLMEVGRSFGLWLDPYNDHLSVVILAIYRVMSEVFGFRYGGYQLVGAVCLLAIPLTLYLTTRRRLGAVLAAIVALSLLGLPDDELYPAALNHYLAVVAAIVAAPALRRGPRADLVVAGSLSLALASAGGGVAVAAACIVHTVCTRAPLRRWVAVALPTATWAAWYLTLGDETPQFSSTVQRDRDETLSFAWDVLRQPFEHYSFGITPIAVALAVGVLGVGVHHLRNGLREAANFLAWSAAALVWAFGLAYGRARALSAFDVIYDRYTLVATVFVLLAVMPNAPIRWPERISNPTPAWRAGAIAIGLCGTFVWASAVATDVRTYSRQATTLGQRARGEALAVAAGPSVVPDDQLMNYPYYGLTAGEVRDLFERFGAPYSATPEDLDAQVIDRFVRVSEDGDRPALCEERLDAPFEYLRKGVLPLYLFSPVNEFKVEVRHVGEPWIMVGEGRPGEALAVGLPNLNITEPWQVRADGACRVGPAPAD